jgi:metal-sulfur cluster biosynthetic enzyme
MENTVANDQQMVPAMVSRIEGVLNRVKDPESNLPVGRLGLVKRVRYSEAQKKLFIFADLYPHLPKCPACSAIALAVSSTLLRDLQREFADEFPDLTIEMV